MKEIHGGKKQQTVKRKKCKKTVKIKKGCTY